MDDWLVFDSPAEARAAGYVSIEAAILLKPQDRSTYVRQAQDRAMPACKVRKKSRLVWFILLSAIEVRSGGDQPSSYAELERDFIAEMLSGSFTGTPLSTKYVKGVIAWGLQRYWKLLQLNPSVAGLNAENFNAAINSDRLSPSDIRRRDFYSTRMHLYRAVTRFTEYLIKRGFKAPADKLSFTLPRRKFKPQKRMLSAEQILDVISFNLNWTAGRTAYDVRLTDILIHLYAYAGIRRIEAATIPKEEINFKKAVMLVYGKGGKARYVPLDLFPGLMNRMRQWMANDPNETELMIVQEDGSPLTEDGIKNRFLRLSAAINLRKAHEKLSLQSTWLKLTKAERTEAAKIAAKRFKNLARPHDFRRSFATILAKQGMPMTLIQVALGHADLSVTQGYVLTDIESVLEYQAASKQAPQAQLSEKDKRLALFAELQKLDYQ